MESDALLVIIGFLLGAGAQSLPGLKNKNTLTRVLTLIEALASHLGPEEGEEKKQDPE